MKPMAPPIPPILTPSRLRWISLSLYLLLPGSLVYSAVGSGQVLYGTDAVAGLYHVRGAIARAFAEGRLPVWEPHVMAGHPLLAAAHGAVLYPPTWLLLVLSVGSFWTLTQFAHLALAGIFARAWLRRGLGIGEGGAILGGLLFQLSGFIVSHLYLGHINHVWAYAWIPALLWRVERFLDAATMKRGILISVVFAMLVLAGMPPYVFYTGLILLARLVHVVVTGPRTRKDRVIGVGWAAAWLVLGLLLCAPQILSTIELTGQAQRTAINAYDFVTTFSRRRFSATLVKRRSGATERSGSPPDSWGSRGWRSRDWAPRDATLSAGSGWGSRSPACCWPWDAIRRYSLPVSIWSRA